MAEVRNKTQKTFKLNLSETNRSPITFVDCVSCTVTINFEFEESPTFRDGYNKWMKLPDDKRTKHLISFTGCTGMKVTEESSLDTLLHFYDCSDCTLKTVNGQESIDLVACRNMSLACIMIPIFRIYMCKNIKLQRNSSSVVYQHNTTELNDTVRWDLESIRSSERFAAALALLDLEESTAAAAK